MTSLQELWLSVGVSGCLSLCISSAIDLKPVLDTPRLFRDVSWDRLEPQCEPKLDMLRKMDGCYRRQNTM